MSFSTMIHELQEFIGILRSECGASEVEIRVEPEVFGWIMATLNREFRIVHEIAPEQVEPNMRINLDGVRVVFKVKGNGR